MGKLEILDKLPGEGEIQILESLPPEYAKYLTPNGKFAQIIFEDGVILEITAKPHKIVLIEWIDPEGWLFDEETLTLSKFIERYPEYTDSVLKLYRSGK